MKPGDKFRCSCGREQAYQPVGKNGGCTEDEARHIGWSQIDTGEWRCPFCTPGGEAKLKAYLDGFILSKAN